MQLQSAVFSDKKVYGQRPRTKSEKIEDKGKNQVTKEVEKELKKSVIESRQKLEKLTSISKSLFKFKNVFPFDFFPDELVIDFNKVSFARHRFFSHTFDITYSIPLEDVGDIVVSSAIFFAKIEITDKTDKNNSIGLSFMEIKDAVKCRRIIQGLIVAKKQGIDLAALANSDIPDLVNRIEQLGKVSEAP